MDEQISTLNLVRRYFNICNIALVRRRNNPIYMAIQTLINKLDNGKVISLKVVDIPKDPGVMPGYYTTRYVDNQFTPVIEGEHDPDTRFTLHKSFLEDVNDNADYYIEHPEKLDWSWLRGRR